MDCRLIREAAVAIASAIVEQRGRSLKELHDDEKAGSEMPLSQEIANRREASADGKPMPVRLEAETAL